MKRRISPSSNGPRKNESVVMDIFAEQKRRVRQEAAAAYAKAKANKLPGKLDWNGFMQKHRTAIEDALCAWHGGGLEPLRTQKK